MRAWAMRCATLTSFLRSAFDTGAVVRKQLDALLKTLSVAVSAARLHAARPRPGRRRRPAAAHALFSAAPALQDVRIVVSVNNLARFESTLSAAHAFYVSHRVLLKTLCQARVRQRPTAPQCAAAAAPMLTGAWRASCRTRSRWGS